MKKAKTINYIEWLEQWFEGNCDGDWEHQHGIHICTLDNPGWSLKISLINTELENKEFMNIENERTENDWIHCKIKNGFFEGFGGSRNLKELIKIFKDWVEDQ